MAISASITLSRNSSQINTPVIASVTISNSGGSPVNFISLSPQLKKTGSTDPAPANSAAAFGLPDRLPSPAPVPAGGSLSMAFSLISFAPSFPDTFDVSADIGMGDGTVVRPTPALLTVTPLARD